MSDTYDSIENIENEVIKKYHEMIDICKKVSSNEVYKASAKDLLNIYCDFLTEYLSGPISFFIRKLFENYINLSIAEIDYKLGEIDLDEYDDKGYIFKQMIQKVENAFNSCLGEIEVDDSITDEVQILKFMEEFLYKYVIGDISLDYCKNAFNLLLNTCKEKNYEKIEYEIGYINTLYEVSKAKDVKIDVIGILHAIQDELLTRNEEISHKEIFNLYHELTLFDLLNSIDNEIEVISIDNDTLNANELYKGLCDIDLIDKKLLSRKVAKINIVKNRYQIVII